LWDIDEALDKIKHHSVVNKKQIKNLRKTDGIEREAGSVVDFKPKSKTFHDPNLSK
jgi:copper(I)-binding protein